VTASQKGITRQRAAAMQISDMQIQISHERADQERQVDRRVDERDGLEPPERDDAGEH
jgi:hypothetical protein